MPGCGCKLRKPMQLQPKKRPQRIAQLACECVAHIFSSMSLRAGLLDVPGANALKQRAECRTPCRIYHTSSFAGSLLHAASHNLRHRNAQFWVWLSLIARAMTERNACSSVWSMPHPLPKLSPQQAACGWYVHIRPPRLICDAVARPAG